MLAVRLGELAGASPQELARHVLRRAPARLRLHVERARGDAAVRRRHRAPGGVLRSSTPATPTRCSRSSRRVGAGPAAGGSRGDGRGGDGQRAPGRAGDVRGIARSRSGSPAGSGFGPGIAGGARVRVRALGRPRASRHGRRRGDPAAHAAAARGARHLALPLRRRRGRGARRDRAAHGRARTTRRSPSWPSRTSTSCSPGSTRRGCGSRRSPPSRARSVWMAGERDRRRVRRDGGVHRPQVALAARALRPAWPSSPRPRRGAWASGRPRSRSCGAPRSRTTSDASASRTRSGRSPGRSGSATGSACGCTRTTPSARSPSRRRWRRSGAWPARTTSGSTAPATTAARVAPALDQAARILAAADCYQAMREARPHRAALDAAAAEAELLREAERGPARPRCRRRGARRRRPPRRAAAARAARGPDRARARGPARARARASEPGDRRRASASRPRPSGTTSSTSTRRPACAAGPPRRSGPSSTTSSTPA